MMTLNLKMCQVLMVICPHHQLNRPVNLSRMPQIPLHTLLTDINNRPFAPISIIWFQFYSLAFPIWFLIRTFVSPYGSDYRHVIWAIAILSLVSTDIPSSERDEKFIFFPPKTIHLFISSRRIHFFDSHHAKMNHEKNRLQNIV